MTPSVPALLVLGLLAERPWSAYELVKALMRPSIAAVVWDASERTWYREPERLVAAGLAERNDSADGSTPTYKITQAGLRALRDARPSEVRFVHRNEVLALLYAAAGGPFEEIEDRLEQMRVMLLDGAEDIALQMRRLADAGPELPRRAHVSALLGRFTARTLTGVYHWVIEAQDELRRLGPDGDRAAFARNVWREIADDLDALLDDQRQSGTAAPDAGVRRR